ncbi:MAG: pantoate--beta-alanine ligase [Fibrobacteria bacterium]|nr:pantoate--beta-alanine ligase [Fibrobacteria bacterium]
MKTYKTITDYRNWRKQLPLGASIGFVPTMGALHQGHMSLVKASCGINSVTVVSIFVNAIQFNSKKDFEKYPVTLERDLEMCKKAGVDAVFIPSQNTMYGENHSTFCEVEQLDTHLCGATRPGHFKGVCTVVLKFFNIIMPTVAYFGQKDFQQAAIICKMVEDLNIHIKIDIKETIREPDGLAMSSRNVRLSVLERERALSIYRGLQKAKQQVHSGIHDTRQLIEVLTAEIEKASPKKIDYISVVSQQTLQPLKELNEPAVIAVAVFFGDTRLIDNIVVEPG